MKKLDIMLAEKMLGIDAVKYQPTAPFLWGTGWYSPIYIDNLAVLSNTQARNFVKTELSSLIIEQFGQADVIAAVATGAIAHGVLVADNLGLPFVYVRPRPKDHRLENQIEGGLKPGAKAVILESTVYTGANSARAAQTIEAAGGEVLGVVAMFNYDFQVAAKTLKKSRLGCVSVGNYDTLVRVAMSKGFLSEADVALLNGWHSDPEGWAAENQGNIVD